MSELEQFYGPNAGYVLDLYERYQQDPASVDPATRSMFQDWNPVAVPSPPRNGSSNGNGSNGSAAPPSHAPAMPQVDVMKVVAAARLTRLVRQRGHLTAHIDPLGSPPPGSPELEIATHGLTTSDLEALPAAIIRGPLAEGAKNALEALGRLRKGVFRLGRL